MLPNRDSVDRLIPLTIDNSQDSDLYDAALTRCMARLINAIQEQNTAKSVDAFKDLLALVNECDHSVDAD
jgi:hypothetical protein